MAANTGIVDIHGTDYKTVAFRLNEFRENHPDWTIETKLIFQNEIKVIMRARILDGEKLIATGYAEEVRDDGSTVNLTSAMENAETSAVGRALAFYGLAGTEIRSADEMSDALIAQGIKQATQRLVDHNEAWKRNEASIHSIKGHLTNERLDAAWEELLEIEEEDRINLRIAPTKGGCFTVEENKLLTQAKADDFDADAGVYRSIADRKGKGSDEMQAAVNLGLITEEEAKRRLQQNNET